MNRCGGSRKNMPPVFAFVRLSTRSVLTFERGDFRRKLWSKHSVPLDVREGSPCPEDGTEGVDVLASSYPHATRVAKLPEPTQTAALAVGLYRGRHGLRA